MKLHFVTSNKGKVAEAQMILGFPIEIIELELPEIQSMDIEEVVREKAQSAFSQLQKPLIVDDAGLYIDMWNGFPGPFVKFIKETGGIELLLRMLKAEKNRKAQFRAAIGFHDGTQVHVFTGEVAGEIATKSRGTNGWGYDPVFIVHTTRRTFAEMNEEEKNAVSHRRNALEKFREFLKEEAILD